MTLSGGGPSAFFMLFLAIGLSNAVWAEAPRVLSKEEKIARNYQLAKSMYDAYANLPERGYPDTWKAEDYAVGFKHGHFLFVSPKGKSISQGNVTLKGQDQKRKWYTYQQNKPMDFKEEDLEEYTLLLKVYPDLRAVTPFRGFCDESGCAFELFCGGHDVRDHKYYEFDEIVFMWTDEYGKLTKAEVFEDWVNEKPFWLRAGYNPEAPAESAVSKTSGTSGSRKR